MVRKNGDNDLQKRASLLRRDSVHGAFNGTITVDEEHNVIWANGTKIQIIYSNDPASVDYTSYGITDAIVVDNTGRWRDEAGRNSISGPRVAPVSCSPHPARVTSKTWSMASITPISPPDDAIVTAASCTTNAITPVLKVINDHYGIQGGHVETVHSFTNDQNLIDNFHRGSRRGRRRRFKHGAHRNRGC